MVNPLQSNSLENFWGVRQVHEHWVSFLILGIILVLLGGIAIAGANVVTLASVIFFGALLTIGGVLQVIYAFWGRNGQGFAQTLLSGIFYTIVGVLLLTHPTVGALTVTILLAAFYTVSGIFKVIVSLAIPTANWGWLLFSGLISLALGVLIWAEWPTSGLWLLGLFIGIDLIFVGWFWIMLSLAARKLTAKP